MLLQVSDGVLLRGTTAIVRVLPETAPSEAISYGWNEDEDLGTDGDWFVDSSVLSSGDGTTVETAFKTIAEAISVATSGHTIKIIGDGVKYREKFRPASGVTVEGYGTDKPVITGAEPLGTGTEWTLASGATDEARLGTTLLNLGVVYKYAGFSKSLLQDSDPDTLNPHENGTKLIHCISWEGGENGDKFFHSNQPDYWLADSVQLSGSTIVSYTSAAITAAYTEAQIVNSTLWGNEGSNRSYSSAISGVSGSVITITETTNTYNNIDLFALRNLLPAMEQGEWGYLDNGDGTLDIYVYPTTPANIQSSIEYSSRDYCISIQGRSNVTLRGLDLRQSAGSGSNNRAGPAIYSFFVGGSSGNGDNITVENCRVSGVVGGGRAAIEIFNFDDVTINDVTVEDCSGTAIGFTGDQNGELTVACERALVQGCLIRHNTFTPIICYATAYSVFAHNKSTDCAKAAHANQMNFYEQCWSNLVIFNIWERMNGYHTWQESSAIHWIGNVAKGSSLENNRTRAHVDQGNGTSPPSGWATPRTGTTDAAIFANNTFLPRPAFLAKTSPGTMTQGASPIANGSNSYKYLNNLCYGMEISAPELVVSRSNNWNPTTHGTYVDDENSVAYTNIWTDADNNDFTIKSDSPIRSATGTDLSTELTLLQSRFGSLFTNWYVDAFGNSFGWITPSIGAVENYDYTDYSTEL